MLLLEFQEFFSLAMGNCVQIVREPKFIINIWI
jgi:hypothetical protein